MEWLRQPIARTYFRLKNKVNHDYNKLDANIIMAVVYTRRNVYVCTVTFTTCEDQPVGTLRTVFTGEFQDPGCNKHDYLTAENPKQLKEQERCANALSSFR